MQHPFRPTRIIDSHTGGEPTRIIVGGGPALAGRTMTERLANFRSEHDHWRKACANEPRGNDVIVGAMLTEPEHAGSLCGVLFFNNVGIIGMCGHGTIGLMATLAYMQRIQPGSYAIDTPVGTVQAQLHEDGSVTVGNVPAYRLHKQVAVDVPGFGTLHGDVAWGGNWFFICADHGLRLDLQHLDQLNACTQAIRKALPANGITGADGAEIDHIELTGAAHSPEHNGRNFVLCPGLAYDRSPCGTGTSAKLACLAADGKLEAGQIWGQESVIGSVFQGSYQWAEPQLGNGAGSRKVQPFVQGKAHVTLDAQLVVDPQDTFAWGLN